MAYLHWGIYHWRPRVVAFRNDFCRACDLPRVAFRVRTFAALHVFWVPLLPLGFWRRWCCSRCGASPHRLLRTRPGFKIAGALCLVLLSLAAWLVPGERESPALVWGMRVGWPALLALTLVSIVRHRPEAGLGDLLLAVTPFEGTRCPACDGELLTAPELHCGACAARHEPLRAAAGAFPPVRRGRLR